MNRDINASFKLGIIDFFGKKPLAANLSKRSIQNHIACSLDHLNAHRTFVFQLRMGVLETFACFMSLGEGKRTATGPDDNFWLI
jgi:hypothetical protein